MLHRNILFGIMFLACYSASPAQSNYIIIGQRDSMIFTQFVPPLLVYYISPFQAFTPEPIDLNHDGVIDLTISPNYSTNGGEGGVDFWCSLEIGLSSSCYLSTGKYEYIASYSDVMCPIGSFTVAKTYLAGDTLDCNNAWLSTAADTCVTYATVSSPGSTCLLIDSNAAGKDDVYYGCKLIVSGNTLLGYLHLSKLSGYSYGGGANVYLYDFAIQGQGATDTILAVSAISTAEEVKVFPIPFKETLHIQSNKHYAYSLYGMNGGLVKTGQGSVIDTRLLENGVYILVLRSENEVIVRKVVKAN